MSSIEIVFNEHEIKDNIIFYYSKSLLGENYNNIKDNIMQWCQINSYEIIDNNTFKIKTENNQKYYVSIIVDNNIITSIKISLEEDIK